MRSVPQVISIQGEGVNVAFTATDPPTLSGGYGGWDEITRPHRDAATSWAGYGARKLTVPGMFDAYGEGRSVEPAVQALDLAARPAATRPPAIVTVNGDVIPIAARATRWVIDNIDWGQDVIRRGDGHRVRQPFTLELVEHVPASLDVRVKKKTPPAMQWVTLTATDTLQTVAVRKLRDVKRAAEIGRINGIRNVRMKLRTKKRTRIRVPVR